MQSAYEPEPSSVCAWCGRPSAATKVSTAAVVGLVADFEQPAASRTAASRADQAAAPGLFQGMRFTILPLPRCGALGRIHLATASRIVSHASGIPDAA